MDNGGMLVYIVESFDRWDAGIVESFDRWDAVIYSIIMENVYGIHYTDMLIAGEGNMIEYTSIVVGKF